MNPFSEQSRPVLAPKARLRFDRHEGRFLLLYPEHGLILNESAGEILHLCTGQLTVEMIVESLAGRHGQRSRDEIHAGVFDLLSELWARGLVRKR